MRPPVMLARMMPPLARTWGRAAVLLSAVLAVGACSGRDGCSRERETPAPPTTAAPAPGVTAGPVAAMGRWSKPPPEPPVDAAESDRPPPTAEELAVMAAALDHELAEL